MAINTNLLVAAPVLQDLLVDTTGIPLASGTVTLYQDNSRTTLKNWYYQTGTPGNYTYITLPNPLTLGGGGTIEDVNGNDVIPFYYPYSEADNSTPQAYYIVVTNSAGQIEFTRQNFPFLPSSSSGAAIATNNNLIANGEFWRNVGSVNVGNSLSTVLAPSQHDGFTMPDIQYIKQATGATETISFIGFVAPSSAPFSDQILPSDVTPEFYMQLNCTGAGTETYKYIQFPIQLHVDNLSGYQGACAVIQAQNVGGSSNNKITLSLYQYTGTGASSSSVTIPLKTITTSGTWEKYIVPFDFPSSQNLNLGGGGDDAWYLQVGFPAGVTSQINIAKPAVYLNTTPPTNDFYTYDQINSIISSPRTGDIRTSLNSFSPFGWVPMNDGIIGNTGIYSGFSARANIDTWPLYNLIWKSFKAYDTGSNSNPICQMYTSAGSATNYGSTSIADFNASKGLALTKIMGKVLLGTVPLSSLLANTTSIGGWSGVVTFSNVGGNLEVTISNSVILNYFVGMPVIFTNSGGSLPDAISANTVYYISNYYSIGSTFNISTTFANAIASTYIAYGSTSGTGTTTVSGAVAGTFEGEYAHTQLLTELVSHHHTLPGQSNVTNAASGSGVNAWSAGSAITGNTGGGIPFNITQPGSFYNIFMKL